MGHFTYLNGAVSMANRMDADNAKNALSFVLIVTNGYGYSCNHNRLKDFFYRFSWNFQNKCLSLSRHNIPYEYGSNDHQQADSRVLQDATRREGMALWLLCPRRATGGQRC